MGGHLDTREAVVISKRLTFVTAVPDNNDICNGCK